MNSWFDWLVGMPPPGSSLAIGDVLSVPADAVPPSDSCFISIEGEEFMVLAYYVLAKDRHEFVIDRVRALQTLVFSAELTDVESLGLL